MEGAGFAGFEWGVPELVDPVHPDCVRATNKAATKIQIIDGLSRGESFLR
jgi:hypothetical protein